MQKPAAIIDTLTMPLSAAMVAKYWDNKGGQQQRHRDVVILAAGADSGQGWRHSGGDSGGREGRGLLARGRHSSGGTGGREGQRLLAGGSTRTTRVLWHLINDVMLLDKRRETKQKIVGRKFTHLLETNNIFSFFGLSFGVWVGRCCENIHSWISLVGDLIFSHQGGIYGFKFPKRFSGDLFLRSHSFTLFLN